MSEQALIQFRADRQLCDEASHVFETIKTPFTKNASISQAINESENLLSDNNTRYYSDVEDALRELKR